MKLNNKKKIMILSFIIPIILISSIVFVLDFLGIQKFKGGANYLLVDMASQYLSLYHFIRDCLLGNASIFYSFSKGLGGNMASTVGYYLGSPLNILYVFASKHTMPLFTFILMVIKLGLCGLFMNCFLDYKYKSKYTNLIFSLSYALMGFTTVYYFNNMWLDVIYMAPLVMLGINKLIDGNSKYYVIFLCLTIIFNFYLAYMVCIFSVIYFLYELFTKYKFKEFKEYYKIILSFGISSLLAAGISCLFLIPILINLSQVLRFKLDPNLLNFNIHNIIKQMPDTIFSKMYIGSHNDTSVLGRNRPVLYICLYCFVLSILYFFNKDIKVKEKILSGLIILFLLTSMLIPHLQLFWQGFSFPNGYIDRFNFLYAFFIIYLSSKCFYSSKVKIRYGIIIYVLILIASYFVSKRYLVFLDKKDIIISLIFVLIYLIIYYLPHKFWKTILIFIVIIELSINYIDTIVTMDSLRIREDYYGYLDEVYPNLTNIEDNFYRIDGDYYYSSLDSFICGTYGYSEALSTNNGNMYRFMKEHGFSLVYTTATFDVDKLPIFDMLFGIKYINSKHELEDTLYKHIKTYEVTKYNSFKKVYEPRSVYLYQNPYALSLGYLIDYKEIKRNKNNNSFDNINDLIKEISGSKDNILKPIKMKKLADGSYEAYIKTNSKNLYFTFEYDIPVNYENYENLMINNEYIDSLNSQNIGTVKVKNKYSNSLINIKLDNHMSQDNRNFYLYDFDEEVFNKVYKKLSKEQMTSVKVSGNKVTGKISSSKEKTLMMAIPYEKGWKVYLDGKSVNYKKIAGNFIGIDIPKGSHSIKMVYHSEGLRLGMIVSGISLLIFVIIEIIKKKGNKIKR